MTMAARDGVAEAASGGAESAEVELVAVVSVEESQASVESVGVGGDILARAGQRTVGRPGRAARAGSSFTGPFAGNPRVQFRKRFGLDRVKRGPTPISKDIT